MKLCPKCRNKVPDEDQIYVDLGFDCHLCIVFILTNQAAPYINIIHESLPSIPSDT